MKALLLICFLFVAKLTYCQEVKPELLLGKEFQQFSELATFQHSTKVHLAKNERFGFSYHVAANSGFIMVTEQLTDGRLKVRSMLTIEKVRKEDFVVNQVINMLGPDDEVIALVRKNEGGKITSIRSAWTYNMIENKFQEIAPKHLDYVGKSKISQVKIN